MSITIQAQLAKKVPIPGAQFSSQQASITISAEVTDLTQVPAEAARIYALAEQAVDAQLGREPTVTPTVPSPGVAAPRPPSSSAPRSATSQPYRQNLQRRGPAPVTDSQLRFLDRLIQQTDTSVPAILEHHQVGALRDLTCKAAAELIDELKSRVPA